MEYRELAATGVKVPEIGFGTWQYRGGSEPLRKAVELGASLIDTAEMYGTEEAVGAAIKGIRQKVFIATKVSGNHLRYDEVLRAADGSLKRLGIDTIDLYQIHWPDPAVPIAETMGAMEQLADAGKVRFIGVSNFYLKNLREAEACMTKHRIVANQVKYKPPPTRRRRRHAPLLLEEPDYRIRLQPSGARRTHKKAVAAQPQRARRAPENRLRDRQDRGSGGAQLVHLETGCHRDSKDRQGGACGRMLCGVGLEAVAESNCCFRESFPRLAIIEYPAGDFVMPGKPDSRKSFHVA